MPGNPATELLFSYGTLQIEAVQLSTFGRKLVGTPDELPGFAQSMMKIDEAEVVATSGKTHHPIVAFTGRASDAVPGTVFQITEEELRNADKYEVAGLLVATTTVAMGQTPVRVRGSLTELSGQTLTVKSREGSVVELKLADGYTVTGVVKAALTDIKPAAFVGAAAFKQSDGTFRAQEV